MANIEKYHVIDSNTLNEEHYFISLLQEAYGCGLLSDIEMENVQMQCIQFLAYKSERYNSGDSSSIRVEVAEGLMKSNLYTVGIYLKSLPDAESAVEEIKAAAISEMYQKGRSMIKTKLNTAKHLYHLVQKNKLNTVHYTYNATVSQHGIESFFTAYDQEYEAHETAASIDYQLCNPVNDLAGVEFIQKYLEHLYLENEFCRNFSERDIHYLLSGYDEKYKDLLLNIFEHVLTAAVGCVLTNRDIIKLEVSKEEVQYLYEELLKEDDDAIRLKIQNAKEKVALVLSITSPALLSYMEQSMPRITANILQGVKTNTLEGIFVTPVNPDLKPRIEFFYGIKMENDDYRKLIDELLTCRHRADKLDLIKEKVKSFGDLEDILFDAQLTQGEIMAVFSLLGDVEMAALMKRHPLQSGIDAVDLSEVELVFRTQLHQYIDKLSEERQKKVFEAVNQLVEEDE